MKTILTLRRQVGCALTCLIGKLLVAPFIRLGRLLNALFHTRPALKRGGLVLVLYSVPVCLAALLSAPTIVVGVVWALALLMLFLGMGAERAATDWDPVFALPPLKSFAFWRWHALEKKRFLAAVSALGGGIAVSAVAELFL